MAVGIVWRQEIPFLAGLLHNRGGDGVGVHGGGVADAEHVPRTARARDWIGVTARDDMEHLLLAGDLGHRDRDARIDVADDEAHLVAFDQLARFLHAGADVVGRVLDQKFNGPAQNAALPVDLPYGVFGADHLVLGDRGIDAGQWIDQADPHWRFTSGLDDEGGR